ncbi:Furin repeat-containing protein [Entamoeba marina]
MDCIKGYYLKDGKCTKGNIDKCYDYDSETKCSSCLEGLAVDENGGCTGKPVENCESYEEGLSTCYRCKEGYCWNEELKECISSSCVGCRVCANTEGTECSNCYYNSYYKDENNICQKNNIEGCDWYDGEGGCMYCEDGYRKNESNICEQCEVEYCMTCFDDVTICSKCSTGYYVDLDDCIKCPDNCADCSYNETTGITCNSCDSNYGLINNECNKCEDTSCRNCDGDTTLCRRCLDDSYILSNFKCDKCNEKCEYSKYDSSKCTYLPYKCIVDDNYCEKMYETGDCIECDNGFTLDNNKCYPYFAATGIDGIDYGCYYYDIDTNDFKDETPIYYFEPVDGHCVNPFVTETSSETTSTETTSSETTSSENSEGEENNNNNEDSCGAITIIIAICVGIGMI